MSLLVAWAVYPLVLGALCAGTGLLVDLLGGRRLPGALVLPVGLAAIVVVGVFATATVATAELTVPLVVALAVAGGGSAALDWRFGRPDPWAVALAVAVFLAFGAPVLFSGEPTFAGYIKLDDTATWLALTDRVMEHGRDLAGLEVGSYRATLKANLAGGYPVGAFVPLALATSALVGVLSVGGVAWLSPMLLVVALISSRAQGGRATLRNALVFVGAAIVLAIPVVIGGGEGDRARKPDHAAQCVAGARGLAQWRLPFRPRRDRAQCDADRA